jgi:hypothetical protein
MSRHAKRRPRGFRRVERWLVGLALAVVAFVLERIVVRSVKKKEPKPQPEPATRLTSKGGDVDFG